MVAEGRPRAPDPRQQALKEANGRERQVAEFRKAAEATAAERSREVETRSERIRIWTDRVERFIEAGYEKRIDPVLLNANSEIYEGLSRLLNKEEALLFQQTKVPARRLPRRAPPRPMSSAGGSRAPRRSVPARHPPQGF